MHRVAVTALEPVAVQQRHEQLEVLLLARVRGRGHQQQVPGVPAEQLPELVALGGVQFRAEVMRRHPVRLVDHHQVPVAAVQLLAQVIGARQLVHPRDQQREPGEHAAVDGGVGELAGEQLEPQAELVRQLLLPLVDQAGRGHDQAAFQVTAQHQLLGIQPRHDRLPGAGVVGQQEPQRGPLQQLPVHRLDLVRQRLKVTGVHREHRVEPGRHPDPQRFCGQLEQRPVRGEVVSGRRFSQREPRLVVAVEQPLIQAPVRSPEGQLERVGADPPHGNHRHRAVADDAADQRAWGYVLESDSHAPRRSLALRTAR